MAGNIVVMNRFNDSPAGLVCGKKPAINNTE